MNELSAIEEARHTYQATDNNLTISVKPSFVPEKSSFENDYYFFAYQVQVQNENDYPIKLLNRQWIIRDGKKNQRYINGEGVVGERPIIQPGTSFQYTSFCPLSTKTGNMRGKFEIETQNHGRFWVSIPLFFFRIPPRQLQ